MEETKALHTFDYQGEKIDLLPDGRYALHEPDDGDPIPFRHYETLAKAQEAVDRRLKTQERTKREKLNIPVYVNITKSERWSSKSTVRFERRQARRDHCGD